MKKYAIILGLTILISSSSVYASQEEVMNLLPETAFRNTVIISPVDILVPTVVSVPIDNSVFLGQQVLVQNNETGEYVGSYLHKTRSLPIIPVTIFTQPKKSDAYILSDGFYKKGVDFEVSPEGESSVTITFKTQKPIVTNQLNFNLAQYVSLPLTVKITAHIISSDKGIVKTLVSKKRLKGTVVTFPEITSDYFEVTFTYAQPLRITEINFKQNGLVDFEQDIRFLAQPNHSYVIYYNVERFVSVKIPESGNLKSDVDILKLPSSNIYSINSLYIPVDFDKDGVQDLIDNCVHIKNFDQIDVDQNGRGDACDDFDRDGVVNIRDNCINNPNSNQSDEDGDGVGDVCDKEESRFTERNAWVPWIGIGTAVSVLLILFMLVAQSPKRKGENDVESSDPAVDSSTQ